MSDFLTRMRRRMAMTHWEGRPSASTAPSHAGELLARGEILPIGVYEDGNGARQYGAAWPGALMSAAQAFTAPGRALQGQMPVETMQGEALNFAGSVGAGGLATGTAPGNALGMFAGRKAKTADLSALARAEDMAAKGADRRAIWDATGWFQGADGKWRWEIDDSGAKLTPWSRDEHGQSNIAWPGRKGLPAAMNVDRWMEHPELERAYWPTRDQGPGVFYDDLEGKGAFYDPSSDNVTMGNRSVLSDDGGRSLGLHELQHAVQGREGFARGSSPAGVKEARKAAALEWRSNLDRLKDSQFGRQATAEISERFGLSRADARDILIADDEALRMFLEVKGKPEVLEWLQSDPRGRALRSEVNDIHQSFRQRRNARVSPHEEYALSAGEVEARNVQKRRDFTPEQRRATPPWETQDVPDAEQIVRFGGGTQASALPMDEASRMARAREMGFDTSTRTIKRPMTPELQTELKAAEADLRAAQKKLSSVPRSGDMTWDKADRIAREMVRRREISPRDMDETAWRLMDEAPRDPDALAAAKAEHDAASARWRAAQQSSEMTVQGMFHGSPDISWMARDGAEFDAARTHDMNLAYGRSPAYTSEDPFAASGYVRAGASWGNGNAENAAPGVANVLVRAKKPFNLEAQFDFDEASEILGDDVARLKDTDHITGRDIWHALVEAAPSYRDLQSESQLIGGDIAEMLPKTEANERLAELGYDALVHLDKYNPGKRGAPHRVMIPFEANQLRSRFAAFDPAKADSADLLASRPFPVQQDENERQRIEDYLRRHRRKQALQGYF